MNEPTQTKTRRWSCCDGYGADVVYEADTADDAAQQYIEDGEWDRSTTSWHDVTVVEVGPDDEPLNEGDEEEITVTLNPDEPECEEEHEHEHEWESPYELLGGIKENPGCWGHGGGVIITEVCRHCGIYRDTDSWAQRPDTGEQGLESVTYREADQASLAWIESLNEDES